MEKNSKWRKKELEKDWKKQKIIQSLNPSLRKLKTLDEKNIIQNSKVQEKFQNPAPIQVKLTGVGHPPDNLSVKNNTKCPFCSNHFLSEDLMDIHLKKAHMHYCNLCDKLFYTQAKLKRHVMYDHVTHFPSGNIKPDNKGGRSK